MTPRRWTGDGLNRLYYGDNLEVLKETIPDGIVDLCYIDPPFNSKRNYNQIYNNIGSEDRAQAQAFIDTWTWDERANAGLDELLSNGSGRFTAQLVDIMAGLAPVLGRGSLLAYLVSMSLRITEIHRVLTDSGTFYLHCDPTASHYLKLVVDAVFCPRGGHFLNEIAWCYRGGGVPRRDFAWKHDVIFRYSKTDQYTFNRDDVRIPYSQDVIDSPVSRFDKSYRSNKVYEGYRPNEKGKHPEDWWPIQPIMPSDKTERLGYPTQKPMALLNRIILASSCKGDVVLDAFCGCGTTIDVAQTLGRQWIGIDITYQSISLVLKRLNDRFGESVADGVVLDGVPRDMASAHALAHKRDDRVRKEFEKWAVLTYSNNRAVINDKRGADGGIDGYSFFRTAAARSAKVIFQVKSGGADRGDVARLRGDMQRAGAALAVLIVLDEPTGPMIREAKAAGQYCHEEMGRSYDVISIVTVQAMLEQNARLSVPMSLDVIADAQRGRDAEQLDLLEVSAARKKPKKAGIERRKQPRRRRA